MGRHICNNSKQAGVCVCPKCGYTVVHNRGVPCSTKYCPVCKLRLVRSDYSQHQNTSNQPNEQHSDVSQQEYPKVKENQKVDVDLCTGCGVCMDACPVNAIEMNPDKAFIMVDICRNCKKCVKVCPVGAIS